MKYLEMRKLMIFPGSRNNLEADLWLNTNLVPILVDTNLLTQAACDFPYTVASSLYMQKIDMCNPCLLCSSLIKEQTQITLLESSAFIILLCHGLGMLVSLSLE